jgi:glycine dehydrogenase subunit 1
VAEKDYETVKDFDAEDIAGMIVQYPNYYGIIEDYKELIDKVHEARGLVIMISDLQSLAVLKSPGELGADIAVGDGQSLGIPLQFGGPYVGYMATTSKYVRRLPGRICGVTKDVDGKRAFVLTLQAREQHIRREKANSNICSNQSLMALWVTIYLSVMGKSGMEKINEVCYNNASYLKEKLLKTKHFKEVYNKPFIKEFVLEANFDYKKVEDVLLDKGYLTGLHIGDNKILFAVTEKYDKKEIDKFVEVLENAI